jgi:hypothetical protein
VRSTLRDLARGIYPPCSDEGLPTALQAQVRKATLPVTIEAAGIGRYSQDSSVRQASKRQRPNRLARAEWTVVLGLGKLDWVIGQRDQQRTTGYPSPLF